MAGDGLLERWACDAVHSRALTAARSRSPAPPQSPRRAARPAARPRGWRRDRSAHRAAPRGRCGTARRSATGSHRPAAPTRGATASGRGRLERDGVAGITHDSQGGDYVLDDVVLDQRAAARQPTGNPRADEVSLEVLADFVAAVQNRVVAPSQAGHRAVGEDVLEQPRGILL